MTTQSSTELYGVELERISEHCHSAQLTEHNIILVKLSAVDRETIDAWIDLSKQHRQTWEAGKPVPVIVDTSSLELAFSPYFFSRGAELMDVRPELQTYIAWVIKRNLVGQLVRGLLGRGSRNNFFSTFYEYDRALDWITRKCEVYQPE